MLVHPEMGFQKAQWKENRSGGRVWCHIRLCIYETDDQKFCSWVLAKGDRKERRSEINWPQAFELGIVGFT